MALRVGIAWRALVLVLPLAGCTTVGGEWEKAVKYDQAWSYESFLRRYPNSEFSDRARARLDERTFQDAVREGKIETIEKYLDTKPSLRYRTEAETRLRSLHEENFKRAAAGGSAADYQKYIETYPKSPFLADAKSKLDDLSWANAVSRGTFAAYRAHYAKFADGKHGAEAKAALVPLKAAALAAESWSKGEAPEACAWICQAKACVDDVDRALWAKVVANYRMVRNTGTEAAYAWTNEGEYSCFSAASRDSKPITVSSCIENKTGLGASVAIHGDAELLKTTRIAPAAIVRWQRSCD